MGSDESGTGDMRNMMQISINEDGGNAKGEQKGYGRATKGESNGEPYKYGRATKGESNGEPKKYGRAKGEPN
jgi:hypothetical protein